MIFNHEDKGVLCRDPDGADVLGGAEWRDARWEIPADREEVLVCTRTKKRGPEYRQGLLCIGSLDTQRDGRGNTPDAASAFSGGITKRKDVTK